MNLMVVSEKHGLLIIGVDHELNVYCLNPVTATITDVKKVKKITLQNDNVNILYKLIWIVIARNKQYEVSHMWREGVHSDSG